MFKIGQKVVCISKFEGVYMKSLLPTNKPMPKEDSIYTISNIGKVVIILEEFGERSFNIIKFAPLDEWEKSGKAVEELMGEFNLIK